MNEKKRKILVFMTLPLALIWAAYNYMSHDTKTKQHEVTASPPSVAVSTATRVPEKFIKISEYESKPWGKDPFQIPEVKQGAASTPTKWILTGIVYNASNPLAVINKQTVRTGNVIDKATVVKIKQDEVILKKDGKQFALRVTKG